MPTLTSLPLSLQTRILRHLCDEEGQKHRSTLRGTNCFLPSRHPVADITLDGADIADSLLPSGLLAPALVSPILAVAAQRLLSSACSYLTDLNTEARLPLWVTAFAKYVKAVSVRGIDLQTGEQLSNELKRVLIDKSCGHAVELFKALSIDTMRLQVLDLVHVPFHATGAVQDSLLSGLCTALESNRSTLTQLALPIYPQSDICARALEMATLPHLTVLSVEMRNAHDLRLVNLQMRKRHSCQFLRMMQAVDGHADRSCHLTTLKELRFFNFFREPCTEMGGSGCSIGFFHAVRTLRVRTNRLVRIPSWTVSHFFALFRKLECLHWDRMPLRWNIDFAKLYSKLNEVHLCHHHWVTGAHVGVEGHNETVLYHTRHVLDNLVVSQGKIRTLVSYDELLPAHLSIVIESCPNLEYFSLHITLRNVQKLRRLIEKCERLTGLELLVDEEEFGRLEKDGWQALGKAIPRSHPKLSMVAIQTRKKHAMVGAPVDVVIDCFTEVVKRVGRRAQRLVFRAGLKSRMWSRIWNALCHILDACTEYSWLLRHLRVELFPRNRPRIAEDPQNMLEIHERLRESRDIMVHSLPYLNKVNLGMMHCWSNDFLQLEYERMKNEAADNHLSKRSKS